MKVADKVIIIDCYESEWAAIYLDGVILYQSDSDYLHVNTAACIFNDLGCEVEIMTCPPDIYYTRQAKYNDPYPNKLEDIEEFLE